MLRILFHGFPRGSARQGRQKLAGIATLHSSPCPSYPFVVNVPMAGVGTSPTVDYTGTGTDSPIAVQVHLHRSVLDLLFADREKKWVRRPKLKDAGSFSPTRPC